MELLTRTATILLFIIYSEAFNDCNATITTTTRSAHSAHWTGDSISPLDSNTFSGMFEEDTNTVPENNNVSSTLDVTAVTSTSTSSDSSNSTSTEQDETNHLLYTIPGPAICSFGIISNILTLCVLSQKVLHESPYIFLTALTTSDLLLLSISFIHFMLENSPNTLPKASFNVYIFFVFANMCFNVSVLVTVAVTIERMLFVKRPLKMLSSRKKARICILLIIIFCAALNVYRAFCFDVVEFDGECFPAYAEFYTTNIAYKFSWIHVILINVLPLIILIGANGVLIWALRKAGKQRVALRSNQQAAMSRDQTRLTRTVVAIVILFFICVTPSAFVEFPVAYVLFGREMTWEEYITTPVNETLIRVSNTLLILNSSLNFLLYSVLNKKFRRVVVSLLKNVCYFKFKRRPKYGRSKREVVTNSFKMSLH